MASTAEFRLLSLPVFLLLIVAGVFAADEQLCDSGDKAALLKMKSHFGNPITLSSWSSTTDCCSQWYGVTCWANSSRVSTLVIQYDNTLSSTIPSFISSITRLDTLILHKLPFLVGPIPESLGMINLSTLWLSWNNLTGPIPEFVGRVKSVNYINLSFNKLTGAIPSSISYLPYLTFLDLSRNGLTGSIPGTLGSSSGVLNTLYLSHNKLSGPIPTSFGSSGQLTFLDLSSNQLIGDVSFLFKKGNVLQYVDLSRNAITFDIGKMDYNPRLSHMDLNHNRVFGRLSGKLKDAKYLLLFNVSYNQLCGEIPQGGRLQENDKYCYLHNKCLCGLPLQACK
ncbi:Polygalacturonase inhibitor-like protein [Drosera capensis]